MPERALEIDGAECLGDADDQPSSMMPTKLVMPPSTTTSRVMTV